MFITSRVMFLMWWQSLNFIFFFKQWKYFPATTKFVVVFPFTRVILGQPRLVKPPRSDLVCLVLAVLHLHLHTNWYQPLFIKKVTVLTHVSKVVQLTFGNVIHIYIVIENYTYTYTYIHTHAYTHILLLWCGTELWGKLFLLMLHSSSPLTTPERCRFNTISKWLNKCIVLGFAYRTKHYYYLFQSYFFKHFQ